MVEQKGYEIFNSISSKINILVVKDLNSKSGKIKKAEKLGIKIISLDDFKKKM